MDATELKNILLAHKRFISGDAGGKRADIRMKDLRGLKLNKINLHEAVLTGCDLSHGSFVGANFGGADLYGCDFTKANLSHACFDRADMRGAKLTGANLEHASMIEVDLRAGQVAEMVWKLQGASLSKEDKGRADDLKENLAEANLSKAQMSSADLESADLQSANFDHANLTKVNFTKAKMGGASLKGANLGEANLSDANLSSACLDDANMRGAVLNSTNLQHASIENVVVPETLSHLDITVRNKMIKHHKWIRTNGEDGIPAHLEGVDLSGTNLRGVNLSGMHLQSSNMQGCNLSDTICLFTFFQESMLTGCNFKNADLDAANFHKCVLKKADFTGANFRPIEVRNKDGKKTGQRWRCNLTEAILIEADFTGALIKEADLRGAVLKDVVVEKATFVGCNMDEGVADSLAKRGAIIKALEDEAYVDSEESAKPVDGP